MASEYRVGEILHDFREDMITRCRRYVIVGINEIDNTYWLGYMNEYEDGEVFSVSLNDLEKWYG